MSIFLTGDLFFGNRSDVLRATMESRQRLCESLAVQFSALVASDDIETIDLTLQNLVLRDGEISSAALRTEDGKLQAESGNHRERWADVAPGKSTMTHTQVPIFKNNQRWGTVEVRFADAAPVSTVDRYLSPFVMLALYISVAGFFAYAFFMKRTLKHLDPGAVIPDRVKSALDVLTEGVVVVDSKGQIVLANAAFTEKINANSRQLLGKRLAQLGWNLEAEQTVPWELAMQTGESQLDQQMQLKMADGTVLTFQVNSSPVQDEKSKPQGALATFDDVTEIVKKNVQLSDMVGELQQSRDEVNRKNEELKVLAERDSLTGCFNRRAFFERAYAEFSEAERSGSELSVIMMDIDFFKAVNDTYGHGVGDDVIKEVGRILEDGMRGAEVVGRYGGEEFCVLLPATDSAQAARIGERLRHEIQEKVWLCDSRIDQKITSSFGVTSTADSAESADALVDRADQALYESKESGRNRVMVWRRPAEPEAAAS
ncbi:diguanylate cyclase [Halieaceae bacterium IMCC14734]|uniref:diguanylate cyclase n=1 Tax=Candidatus Litorirhabdus singularis TaxID=2518993 RepID=A0ABT3TFS3_9GAMM|nr:sensor domain-containing diguanylate cyclase [Candidatus Litorirhabdus singularis]MCX2980884.1 diguanylate cyclase [Candidatus Litorirhabdus singularis]